MMSEVPSFIIHMWSLIDKKKNRKELMESISQIQERNHDASFWWERYKIHEWSKVLVGSEFG